MKFGTMPEFRRAVKGLMEGGDIPEAARVILENSDAVSQWWLDWAFGVVSGTITPTQPKPEIVESLKDGDLFGEPITTGRRLRVRGRNRVASW